VASSPTFELILPGPPVSSQNQTGAKSVWQASIERAALLTLGGTPVIEQPPLCFSASNYFKGRAVVPDVDNMLKPIQDALEHVVYDNDRDLFDSLGTKRDLTNAIHFEGAISRALQSALDSGAEFVHIQLSSLGYRHFGGL
jgi:hypothetical protein